MIRYFEIDGPDWADRTFEFQHNGQRLFTIGCKVQSLIEKKLYIGVTDIAELSFSQLRELRKLFAHAFVGWTVAAVVSCTDATAMKFARFFGFEWQATTPSMIFYERKC